MLNIIIQAGGLGTRLKNNTTNKPKCLVPLNGKPIIQYTLEKFSNANFYIIADYKIDVLQKYINLVYSKYNIKIIQAEKKGTCAGIKEAIKNIHNDYPIFLVWSDLIIEDELEYPEEEITVYKTNAVTCRYSVEDNKIVKKTSEKDGVVGLFSFKSKSILSDIQESGSFVGEWLQKMQKNIRYKNIEKIKEIGTLDLLDKNSNKFFCRHFNSVNLCDDKVIKYCINDEYKDVYENEINWYQYVIDHRYEKIAKVYSLQPLTLEYVDSKQCHKFSFSDESKMHILKNICNMMLELNNIDHKEKNVEDLHDVYLNKTLARVEKVSSLIPFFNEKHIIINDKKNVNPFHEESLEYFCNILKNIDCDKFSVIHGDPTFSNILVKENLDTIFIDPRGVFGKTKIYGDKDYDYSKLFYSLVGNYDSVNTREFKIDIDDAVVKYTLRSNGWEHLEDLFYSIFPIEKKKNLLLNSIIWFSLCGYVIEDYDAILLSFCRGIEFWNQFLESNFQT